MKIKIDDFEELRKKISTVKEKQSRIEGALDQIEEQLKKEEGIKNIDDAEAIVGKLNQETEAHLKKEDELLEKLNKIIDWEKL